MSAWAYCQGDDCHQPIQRDDYSAQQIMDGYYDCPTCGYTNDVQCFSPGEYIQSLEDRIVKLEEQMKRCMKV